MDAACGHPAGIMKGRTGVFSFVLWFGGGVYELNSHLTKILPHGSQNGTNRCNSVQIENQIQVLADARKSSVIDGLDARSAFDFKSCVSASSTIPAARKQGEK